MGSHTLESLLLKLLLGVVWPYHVFGLELFSMIVGLGSVDLLLFPGWSLAEEGTALTGVP